MFGRSNDTVQEAYNNLWGTDQGDDDDFNNEQQRDDIFTLLSTSNNTSTSDNNAAKTMPTLSLPIQTPSFAINSTPFNSRGNSSSVSNNIKSDTRNHPKRRSTSSQPSNIVTISPFNKISNQTSTTLDTTVANGKPNLQRRKPSKRKSANSNVQLDSKNSTNTILDNAERQMSTPILSSSPLNPSTTPTSSSTHVSPSNFLSASNDDIDSENDQCTSNNIKLAASTEKFLLDLNMSKKLHDNISSNNNGQTTLISLSSDNVKQNVEKLITGENIKPEIRKRKPYTKRAKSNDNVNTSKRKPKLNNQDDENLLKPNINSHSNMCTSDISTTTATNGNAVSSSYTFRSVYYMCSNKHCKLLVEHTCKQNYYDFYTLMGQLLNNNTKTVIESNMLITIEPKKLHICTHCSFSFYHSSCVLLENDVNNSNSITTHKLFCKYCNFTANYCTKHSQSCRIVEQSCTAVTLRSCECLNATHYCN